MALAALAALASLPAAPLGARAHAAEPWNVALGVVPDLDGSALPVLPPVLDGERASGAVFIGYRGSEGEATGAVVTVAPGWSSFVRIGAEVTPGSRTGDLGFLWGFGFERWQDRTFFLHVHDWGPMATGSRLTLRSAQASFGYKLPTACLRALCLASTAFAGAPFSGGPYLAGRVTLTVLGAWFVTGAIGWTIPGALPGSGAPPPWRLSFALGRVDGRPGGLFLTYRDEALVGRLGSWTAASRQGNGVVAAGVSWAY